MLGRAGILRSSVSRPPNELIHLTFFTLIPLGLRIHNSPSETELSESSIQNPQDQITNSQATAYILLLNSHANKLILEFPILTPLTCDSGC